MDGAVKFNVSANTAQFDSAMRRVGSVAQTTGDRVRSAFSGLGGLLAGGAIVAGLQGVLRKMDDISDRAKRFGVTVEEIQKIGNAAEIVGTDFETVARAMNRTGVAANKAARDGGAMAEAFARVNLDPAEFAAATLQERVQMIAKAQQAANGDAAKMARLFEVIGVRAANINFAELSKEMGNVNAASSDVVERLAEANDLLTKMRQNATIFGANLLKALVIDPAQRIGSFLGGEGFKTVDEVQKKYERKMAEDQLRQRGQLLPDDTTFRRGTVNTPVGTVPGGLEGVAGPNALENARRIDAEIARIKAERKAAEDAIRNAVDQVNEEPASDPEKHQTKAKDRLNRHLERLRSRYTSELRAIRTRSGISQDERQQMRSVLDAQYMDARNAAFQNMATNASVPEAARQRAAEEARAASGIDSAQSDRATETTLQKVAKFLEELNTKLPQPVLV